MVADKKKSELVEASFSEERKEKRRKPALFCGGEKKEKLKERREIEGERENGHSDFKRKGWFFWTFLV